MHNAVIFKLADNTISEGAIRKKLSEELSDIEIYNLNQKFPKAVVPNSNWNRLGKDNYSLHLIYEFNYDGSVTPERLALELTNWNEIKYAQPHFLPKTAFTPNDELLVRQDNYLSLIQAYEGWGVATGDSSVIIGLVDTGTDVDHPDLVENFAYNTDDPLNGIDDDQDGFVDNLLGWDLAEDDSSVQSVIVHHGVHLNGLIGATPNNGIGVAGIGYNCRVLPIKAARDGSNFVVAAYEGVKYAADQGCSIINCSWGGYRVGDFERDIIDYAVNQKNCLVIAAAGNEEFDSLLFPAAFEGVVAVAATDMNDVKVSSSNFNTDVDISAPGRLVYATWNEGVYQTNTGTSVSTAVVSAVAGVLKSAFPDLSNQQLVERIKETSDFIYNENPQFIGKLGRGRVNLLRALNDDRTVVFKPFDFQVFPNPVNSDGSSFFNCYFHLEKAAQVEIQLFDVMGLKTDLIPPAQFEDGIYEFSISTLEFPAGIYFVRMKRGNKEIVKKLIIQ